MSEERYILKKPIEAELQTREVWVRVDDQDEFRQKPVCYWLGDHPKYKMPVGFFENNFVRVEDIKQQIRDAVKDFRSGIVPVYSGSTLTINCPSEDEFVDRVLAVLFSNPKETEQ